MLLSFFKNTNPPRISKIFKRSTLAMSSSKNEWQFEMFKKHMQQIENVESMQQAAQMLAKLQNNSQDVKEELQEVDRQIEEYEKSHPHITELLNRSLLAQSLIAAQYEESKLIQMRSNRQIQNTKIYGIAKIAKQVLQTSDHLMQAIKMSQRSQHNSQVILQVHQHFHKVLSVYEIYQFTPLEEPFNPNQQESMEVVIAEQIQKKNVVAQVKRSGFKLRERLLRPAYVTIFI